MRIPHAGSAQPDLLWIDNSFWNEFLRRLGRALLPSLS